LISQPVALQRSATFIPRAAPSTDAVRDEQVRAGRGKVLVAARDLFLRRGHIGTTIEAVAQRARVGPQTVYNVIGGRTRAGGVALAGSGTGGTARAFCRRRPRNGGCVMIGFIVAGLVIGALARLIKPGKQNLGLLATLLLGLAGSVIGGVVANLLGTGSIFELNVLGFVVAVIASVLLVGVAESLSGSRSRAVR
jgi:uncharacterized membrane protein YeaQ/YmgE (transglycosylase-associated protein family)